MPRLRGDKVFLTWPFCRTPGAAYLVLASQLNPDRPLESMYRLDMPDAEGWFEEQFLLDAPDIAEGGYQTERDAYVKRGDQKQGAALGENDSQSVNDLDAEALARPLP